MNDLEPEILVVLTGVCNINVHNNTRNNIKTKAAVSKLHIDGCSVGFE